MRLHRQLILLLLAALLPFGLLLAVFGVTALRDGREAVDRELAAKVSVATVQVSRELDAQIEVLGSIAQSPLLDGRPDRPKLELYLKRVLQQQPLWRVVTVLDLQGRRLVQAPAVAPGGPARVIDVTTFSQALRERRPVIGRVFRPERLRPGFVVFVPVVRDGRVICMLSAVIEPSALRSRLLSSDLPPGWSAAVMDKRYRIVARTYLEQEAGEPASRAAARAVAHAARGRYRATTVDRLDIVSGYERLPQSGWSVHVAVPASMYEAPVRRAILQLVFGGLASLLLTGLFLWLLWREVRLRQADARRQEEGRRLEALGRMTGGVAHDVNNILMIVQGSAELLTRGLTGDARAAALAEAVLSAAQRGQMLTRQLLAFGRRGLQDPRDFRLQDRLPALRPLLQRSTSASIALEIQVDGDVWPIRADPDALEVALINLAVNARDAMTDGGRLTISAENLSLPGGRGEPPGLAGDFVAIRVADTGTGIGEADLVHVFEPFYTTKPEGRGTGLGLSQVYGFAKQAGGEVRLESRLGEGTTVTLYLPRGAEPATRQPAPAPEVASGHGRLLLVEDNADVAAVTSAMLSAAGYQVEHCAEAASALRRLSAGEGFDLIVSDIMLGGMSGLELARAVRAAHPALPVLLVSGYSAAAAEGAAPEFPVLAKPFGAAELLTAVGLALQPDPEPALAG